MLLPKRMLSDNMAPQFSFVKYACKASMDAQTAQILAGREA